MHWFLDPIQKHYADFEGRVGRQEFWMFILFCFGLNIILEVIGIEVLSMVVSLALFIPSIALGTRRLHDIGKSGWWQLLWIIPIIGWIILIVWFATDTIQADNEYGAPARPKVVAGITLAAAAPAAAPVAEAVHTETPAHTTDTPSAAPTEVAQTESDSSNNNS